MNFSEIHPENFRAPIHEVRALKRYPISVLLENVRSLYNVGSIFRIADGCLTEQVYLTGYTGVPPRKEIHKTALGADEVVPWKHYKQSMRIARMLKKQSVQLVALETGENSIDYVDFMPKFPMCLMLGNEIEGLSKELLDFADVKIRLPMRGRKNSLNVSVAFGIAAYRLAEKWEQKTLR